MRRIDLQRGNLKFAKIRLKRGHAALETLKMYSNQFRFSLSLGDLLFLEQSWYVTHVGLIRARIYLPRPPLGGYDTHMSRLEYYLWGSDFMIGGIGWYFGGAYGALGCFVIGALLILSGLRKKDESEKRPSILIDERT